LKKNVEKPGVRILHCAGCRPTCNRLQLELEIRKALDLHGFVIDDRDFDVALMIKACAARCMEDNMRSGIYIVESVEDALDKIDEVLLLLHLHFNRKEPV